MAAAADLAERRRQERLANEKLMSCHVTVLMKRILSFVPEFSFNGKLSMAIDDILKIDIDRHTMEKAFLDPVAVDALNGLDIDPHDHDKLPDILDPNHSGSTNVLAIVNGLQKLRGDPRRSDIVSASLMIRSLQDVVEDMFCIVNKLR